ncbi:hypothetical protein [Mycobacterium antarcticum]|uniref:hypothetical protein n=1 Tax=unclassified Mycolicibacterium TaxID=2636767 RepID=UPI0024E0AB82|nr:MULTISPECIES: hypothetical protein [unclassified Mycolicibacterium]
MTFSITRGVASAAEEDSDSEDGDDEDFDDDSEDSEDGVGDSSLGEDGALVADVGATSPGEGGGVDDPLAGSGLVVTGLDVARSVVGSVVVEVTGGGVLAGAGRVDVTTGSGAGATGAGARVCGGASAVCATVGSTVGTGV